MLPKGEDVASGRWFGADVLFVCVEQDFGYSVYHDFLAQRFDDGSGFVAGFPPWAHALYATHYDRIAAARPFFRGHATFLYHDTDTLTYAPGEAAVPSPADARETYYSTNPYDVATQLALWTAWNAANLGMVGWAKAQANWVAFKDAALAGTGNYAGRALADQGWTFKGDVGYLSPAAAGAAFLADVTDHFGL